MNEKSEYFNIGTILSYLIGQELLWPSDTETSEQLHLEKTMFSKLKNCRANLTTTAVDDEFKDIPIWKFKQSFSAAVAEQVENAVWGKLDESYHNKNVELYKLDSVVNMLTYFRQLMAAAPGSAETDNLIKRVDDFLSKGDDAPDNLQSILSDVIRLSTNEKLYSNRTGQQAADRPRKKARQVVKGEYSIYPSGDQPERVEVAAGIRKISAENMIMLQSSEIITKPGFVAEAREEEFAAIDNKLEHDHIVFLVGLGGIGKSELAKQWALRNRSKYSTVVFAQSGSSTGRNGIRDIIADDSVFILKGFLSKSEMYTNYGITESDDEYYKRKLGKLKQISDRNTLLVIDNYNVDEDPYLPEFLSGSYSIIITTRNQGIAEGYPTVGIDAVADDEKIRKVFFSHLNGKRTDITADDMYLSEIFSLLKNHTLATEILAKLFSNSVKTPKEVFEALRSESGIKLFRQPIKLAPYSARMTPYECICALFDLSEIKNDYYYEAEISVLAFMSLMPVSGISMDILRKWCDDDLYAATCALIEKSWLSLGDGDFVSMHPLICDVVSDNLDTSFEAVEPFIAGIVNDPYISDDWLYHQPLSVKRQYHSVIKMLLARFSDIDLDRFEFIASAVRVMQFNDDSPDAHSLCEKVMQRLAAEGKDESFEMAYMLFRDASVCATRRFESNRVLEKYSAAEKMMSRCSLTGYFELKAYANLVRDMATVYSRRMLGDKTRPMAAKFYMQKGMDTIGRMIEAGYSSAYISIYPGTIDLWLAMTEIYEQKISDAEKHIEEADALFRENGYINRLDYGAVLICRARICNCRRNYDTAEQYLLQALTLYSGSFDKDSKIYINTSMLLANVYHLNRKYTEEKRVLENCAELISQKHSVSDKTAESLRLHMTILSQGDETALRDIFSEQDGYFADYPRVNLPCADDAYDDGCDS